MGMRACAKCGVLYDTEITLVEKYKEHEGMGCRIHKTKCPVCGINAYTGGDEFAFTNDEVKEFLES